MNIHGNFVLAHLSDLHLGYKAGSKTTSSGVNVREDDGYRAFHEIVDQIIADGTVDAVLIAGDLFHTPNPSIRSIVCAQNELRRLTESLNCKVYILSGNHDQSDIHSEIASSVAVNDPKYGIYSTDDPYEAYEIYPGVVLHMVSHHLFADQAATFDEIKPFSAALNILSAHGTMHDESQHNKVLHMDAPAPREIILPSNLLDNPLWTRCLLGHIHERQFVGASKRVYYNGSTLRRGFSDGVTNLGRGWTKWTITPSGLITPDFKQIWQRPQADFPLIDAANMSIGELNELIISRLETSMNDLDASDLMNQPILRQKVVNLSIVKKRSLDYEHINSLASKALTWSLSTATIDQNAGSEEAQKVPENSTLTDIYQNWAQKCDVVQQLDDKIQTQVVSQAQHLLTQSTESLYNAED